VSNNIHESVLLHSDVLHRDYIWKVCALNLKPVLPNYLHRPLHSSRIEVPKLCSAEPQGYINKFSYG
jgi:hypothetical protein